MRKIMNKPEDYYKEMSRGFLYANEKRLSYLDDGHLTVRNDMTEEKVAAIAVCDGGHLPMYQGYVGEGMLDGCVIGDVFQSPSTDQICQAAGECDCGEGVLILYGYDFPELISNVQVAESRLLSKGMNVKAFAIHDNAMNIPPRPFNERTSTPGAILIAKIAGAAAWQGQSLEAVYKICEQASSRLRSMGAIAQFCFDPVTHECKNPIEDGYMNIGAGYHGEAGFETIPFPPAEIMAEHMFRKMINLELDIRSGDHVAVLVNGLGNVPAESLYVYYSTLHDCITEKGAVISDVLIGEYGTSLDTCGISCSVMILDEQLEALMLAPADTLMIKR